MSNLIVWSPGITLAMIEEQTIIAAYRHYRENKTATASSLGISVRSLHDKMAAYEQQEKDRKLADEQRAVRDADFLARCRGEKVPERPAQIDGPKAVAGPSLESVADTPAQQPVSLSERKEVQVVLPPRAAGSGGGKGR